MHIKRRRVITISICMLLYCAVVPKQSRGMTLSGTINVSSVSVTGNVTVSSMTVSTMTITNFLKVNQKINGIKGLILQTILSSTTSNSSTTSTSLTPIPGMSATITLSSALNYVRISLCGVLQAPPSTDLSNLNPVVNLSIERDSTDLGQGAFITTQNTNGIPVGLTITDSPNDTSPHTYQATFDIDSTSGTVANFTASPLGYLLLEEVAQ